MILSVSPFIEDHAFLRGLFPRPAWTVCETNTYQEALPVLSKCKDDLFVILCEASLSDGTWKDLLDEVLLWPDAPRLIVTSRLADERLWAEVLNLGGYDVLAKPFDRGEVSWVVTLALPRSDSRKPARREGVGRSIRHAGCGQ